MAAGSYCCCVAQVLTAPNWAATAAPVFTNRPLPWSRIQSVSSSPPAAISSATLSILRSEEHTSELQSRPHLVCRLLLEKKKKKKNKQNYNKEKQNTTNK